MSRPPGWYPDPEGQQQVRLWDGDSWTAYVQPFAPQVPQRRGSATALEDYPYLAQQHARPGAEPVIVSTWAPVPVGPPGRASSSRGRSRFTVPLIVAALAVVAAVVAGLWLLGPRDRAGTADPAEVTGELAPGGTASATIPAAGSWIVALTVTEPGWHLIQATSDDDVELSVVTSQGAQVAASDDQGAALAELLGGGGLDASVFVHLDAGGYTVTLAEVGGGRTDAHVSAEPVTLAALEPGVPLALDVPTDGWTGAVVSLASEAEVIVDARATDASDPRMVVLRPGASAVLLDDRSDDQAAATGAGRHDPLYVGPLPAGETVLLFDEYVGYSAAVSVTVTVG